MSQLLGPNGKPISSEVLNKKAAPPPTGEQYGRWSGADVQYLSLPGGGAIQFDLSRLTLSDFRQMTDHYQINSSLAVLTFLLHQIEWRIICEDKRAESFYQESIDAIWTRLVRAKSQAFWAGYSPNVLQWQNDTQGRRVVLEKIKDLIPEDCEVKWKKVNGAGTNKISVYDGIKQWGSIEIPVDCTYWYPLLMQNGDYYGRKLLKPAFQPWFFSILIHLFANRYYERFGEPTPVARAPYEDTVNVDGQEMRGNKAMELILTQLRNRSMVVLPNEKTQFGDENDLDYDYQIEYLESQMRGADFERYMTRLDEEMSLALFTPILLMRTADVGSYNLGDMQSVIYQWMLNAIAGDWKQYIDWYILRPLRDYNFGTNAPRPQIQFRRMGAQNEELVRDIVRLMIEKDKVKPDLDQLGEMSGLSLSQVRELTSDNPDDPPADNTPEEDPNSGDTSNDVLEKIIQRLSGQVHNCFKKNNLESANLSMAYKSQFTNSLKREDVPTYLNRANTFYTIGNTLLSDMSAFGCTEWKSADNFLRTFRNAMTSQLKSTARK